MQRNEGLNRRRFLTSTAIAGVCSAAQARTPTADRARIAISLDLEMSRQYPRPEDMHWDYEKGNLDKPTKAYAVEAGKRVKAAGGRVHFFALGRTMEQERVDWLTSIVADGHAVGNHSYDHINMKSARPADLQFRFQRAPWLIEGKSVAEVIESNIRLAHRALETRAGIKVSGFRTPGGFRDGLSDRPDLQEMLKRLGYRWVSSVYPAHPTGQAGDAQTAATFAGILEAQQKAQPFVYPSGLVEIPMSPVSDVTTMRAAKWSRPAFLEAIRRSVAWAIENRAVFDFLGHPSCLVVTDPHFEAIELILKLVRESNGRAEIVTLDQIAAPLLVGGRGSFSSVLLG